MINVRKTISRAQGGFKRRGYWLVRTAAEMDRISLLVATAQILLVTAAFLNFVLQPEWLPVLGVLARSEWLLVYVYGFLFAVGFGWLTRQALTAKVVTFLMTAVTLLTLGLITAFLAWEAWPAFREVGIDLVWPFGSNEWAAAQNQFSLVPMMWGTALTTAVAIAVAAPFGVAGALFISDIAPDWLREIIKPAVELLAGIPSIVYGFIGFTLINPYIGNLFSVNPGALFAIGIVIGFMALPTVVSVAEDALSAVPDSMKDGSGVADDEKCLHPDGLLGNLGGGLARDRPRNR